MDPWTAQKEKERVSNVSRKRGKRSRRTKVMEGEAKEIETPNRKLIPIQCPTSNCGKLNSAECNTDYVTVAKPAGLSTKPTRLRAEILHFQGRYCPLSLCGSI